MFKKDEEELEKVKEIFKEPFINAFNKMDNDPLAGEILGIMVFENKPLTVKEISDRTGYSVSHISNKIRRLKSRSFVREERKPGSRKNFYKIEDLEEWPLNLVKDVIESTKSIIETTNKCKKIVDDEEKKEHLEFVENKYTIINKSLRLLQSIEEEELEKLFEKYDIDDP